MAAIASGLNFSTLNAEGISLATCYTVNTTANPEYPGMPFAFGTETIGLDGSKWIFAKPAANYAIGTVGYFDTSWNFTALTSTNAANVSGQKVGVMSQVASVTASPSSTVYDGVWVQIDGLCPAVQVAASTTANAQLYTSATAGQLTSTSSSNVAINGIVLTTAQGAGGAGTQPGVMNGPEVLLTT